MTCWKLKATGYRKINEKFFFTSVSSTFTFSGDGKYFFTDENSGQDITIYDAISLDKVKSIKLECKDQYDNPIAYFYGTVFSQDGSYLLAGDSYTRYIFDAKTGKYLNK